MILLSFLSSSRQQEGCDDASPQTINYEKIVPLGLSADLKADAVPMPCESSSLQLVNNTAYCDVWKTEQHKESDPTRKNQAVPLEAYGQKSKPRGL